MESITSFDWELLILMHLFVIHVLMSANSYLIDPISKEYDLVIVGVRVTAEERAPS